MSPGERLSRLPDEDRPAPGRRSTRASAGGRPSLFGLMPPVVERVDTRDWRAACERQAQAGGRFCGLFAGAGAQGLQVSCLFARADRDHVVCAPAPSGAIDTLIDLFGAANQDEREAHDCYGVRFDGHEPLRPLVDHPAELAAWSTPVRGHDPYQVAVGPIHAGVIESAHFRFTVVGERILHLDLRLSYKHRGLQTAAERRPLAEGLRYVQRACAACAVTNTVAYAQACESALGLEPDRDLRRARTLLLELERLYNHLNDVSAICAGVGFAPGAMAFAAFKERAQRLNMCLAGHRFLFGTVALAASALRVCQAEAHAARQELRALHEQQRSLWRELRFAGSVQDRLGGVGAITREDAMQLGTVGPAARASGVRHDTRGESPRLCYSGFAPAAPEQAAGDVAARLDIRRVELEQTFAMLDELLAGEIGPGGVKGLDIPAAGVGMSRVESPRGETVCAVQSDGHVIERLHLRTGSYANWPAVARASREGMLPDFPLINKSFELCYACVDR
jgi:Ni,Fe-hydrogenase III large subunit